MATIDRISANLAQFYPVDGCGSSQILCELALLRQEVSTVSGNTQPPKTSLIQRLMLFSQLASQTTRLLNFTNSTDGHKLSLWLFFFLAAMCRFFPTASKYSTQCRKLHPISIYSVQCSTHESE